MADNKILSSQAIKDYKISPDRKLFSAEHEEILQGLTTDVYFVKSYEILKDLELLESEVTVEIFSRSQGVFCGLPETLNLLQGTGVEVWSLNEGDLFQAKEVIMRIKGKYANFGIYETAILGVLASSCGWATAARQVKIAAGDKPAIIFGARHVHPAVAPVMERSAIVGGMDGSSCILGAKLAGLEPKGTLPHAVILIAGDTLKVAQSYDKIMAADDSRLVLVDTFKDEAEETLRIAAEMQERLQGIRLDTPSERGGVTPGLVQEIRIRLDQKGFKHVKILVSGGLSPDRISLLKDAGADMFGVGSFVSGASAIDMTMDIKELNGQPIAKRGRIPGTTYTERLIKHEVII
jgi:nicotinate phosphoribosyltransferase